jgi:cytoskeleton protein RodZ
MNQTQFIDANEQNVVEFGDSPGRRLRVQRQSRGLTIERIGAQLHLKPEIIDALEQDRFEDLPDGVFVMGYLRNYARLLGLDPIR